MSHLSQPWPITCFADRPTPRRSSPDASGQTMHSVFVVHVPYPVVFLKPAHLTPQWYRHPIPVNPVVRQPHLPVLYPAPNAGHTPAHSRQGDAALQPLFSVPQTVNPTGPVIHGDVAKQKPDTGQSWALNPYCTENWRRILRISRNSHGQRMPLTTLLQKTSGRNATLITKNSDQNTTTSIVSESSMTISACCHSAILRNN
ncbi:hypothetical [Yersinia pestis KIM10+]|uniref:Uncharacterized protein n=1 Tax=Yersinia pestis TaxID=632 RepID=Q8CLU5_YERPE|nr:hypothetical [Yersinia pestis KIM10+]